MPARFLNVLTFPRAAFVVPLLWVAGCISTVHSFETNGQLKAIELGDLPGFKPVLIEDLPSLQDEVETKVTKSGRVHVSGLVSTINFEEFDKRKPDADDQSIKLSPEETGFKKEIRVHLYRQPGKAPLAVTLLGFGQAYDDKLPRAWAAYLYNSGCHVLSFDSLIRNNMNEACGHGVAGNVVAESRIAAKIIDAVLARQRKDDAAFKTYVSSVRLLGTSYGGLLALQCLREPQAAVWPVDRCLVLSMPIDMGMAAKRLDSFSREDKPFFGKLSLMKLLHGFTPKEGTPNAEEEALMRAGIGYCFHGDLTDLAKSNIRRYCPDLPKRLDTWCTQPEQCALHKEMLDNLEARQAAERKALDETYHDGRDRDTKAEYEKARDAMKARHKIQKMVAERQPNDIGEWNFQDYVFFLMKPYWKMNRGMNAPVTVENLLSGAPNFVEVFVAADDPLNDPAELKDMSKRLGPPRLNVMPYGGHLGYTGTRWASALVTAFFKSDNAVSGNAASEFLPPK